MRSENFFLKQYLATNEYLNYIRLDKINYNKSC